MTPASPSKLSTYACCFALPCGRLVANSPCTLTRDGTDVATKGRRLTRRGSGPTSPASCPFTPATRDRVCSSPSCGRGKLVLCDCWGGLKLSSPLPTDSVLVTPHSVGGVAASANVGFSS